MKSSFKVLLVSFILLFCSTIAIADDIEGRIQSIDARDHSFIVQGIEFFVTPPTDYDDGLKGFTTLRVGQKVEVDFEYRDGRHFATEIELED